MNLNQNQNFQFFVKVNQIIPNTSNISQNYDEKTYKICILKGTEKLSQKKINLNNKQQELNKGNNIAFECYFSLLKYSHRKPVQLILKIYKVDLRNVQQLIFQHKLYSYKLVNSFLNKKQNIIQETIKTGFETEVLLQIFIQSSKQKLQQLIQSQKQNKYSIKINSQTNFQKINSNQNLKKDTSFLSPSQQIRSSSKTQTSTPTAMYKLGLFQSFADQQTYQQEFSPFTRPRFNSSIQYHQNKQFDLKKNASLVNQEKQQKIHQISTQMDKYIGYHIQNTIQTRSNRSKISLASSKKSNNTIIRSFKSLKSSKCTQNTVQSPQISQTKQEVQQSFLTQSQIQQNWQEQTKKSKIYLLILIFVFFGLMYYLVGDGGHQIYSKKKLKKKRGKIQQQIYHL